MLGKRRGGTGAEAGAEARVHWFGYVVQRKEASDVGGAEAGGRG